MTNGEAMAVIMAGMAGRVPTALEVRMVATALAAFAPEVVVSDDYEGPPLVELLASQVSA